MCLMASDYSIADSSPNLDDASESYHNIAASVGPSFYLSPSSESLLSSMMQCLICLAAAQPTTDIDERLVEGSRDSRNPMTLRDGNEESDLTVEPDSDGGTEHSVDDAVGNVGTIKADNSFSHRLRTPPSTQRPVSDRIGIILCCCDLYRSYRSRMVGADSGAMCSLPLSLPQ